MPPSCVREVRIASHRFRWHVLLQTRERKFPVNTLAAVVKIWFRCLTLPVIKKDMLEKCSKMGADRETSNEACWQYLHKELEHEALFTLEYFLKFVCQLTTRYSERTR